METNKILGAIILALLLAAAFSKIADMAVHPEFPEELAYKIEIPEGGSTSAQAEDGIRDFCLSRGLGDVYKRQLLYLLD